MNPNPSKNKEIAGRKKFFDLKKDTEKTIVFPAGINRVQVIAAVDVANHIRINHGVNIATEDNTSYKFDSNMSSFELVSNDPFTDISFLANFDVTLQLVCPRSLA